MSIGSDLFIPSQNVFRVDLLALNKELVYSFLEKTTFPTPSFTSLPVVLCVEWDFLGFFPPAMACPFLLFLFSLCLGSHVCESLWV